ncbi:adenosylcobinamide-phosphate synthase CbiB [Solimonas marina]|uniref:Cobalamin biosynthesis protein CobD n=1 Tax=Solimonas marina TaxID=2714601 RepID=A0A970B4U6_9GAMM|nr:adenosylcobinamide-phosphate synthase CbiB [Solimonas marina]NKF21008.1 cobalamin biosynthesis protein [Solimonas marina]
MNLLLMLPALLLDAAFGEPRRGHPLVVFGRVASRVEAVFNRGRAQRARGVVALLLLVLPPLALSAWLVRQAWLGPVFATLALYVCVGHRSLSEHARRVAEALRAGELPLARSRVGAIVSRDTEDMDATRVASATVESVLENGNDAVFGALFWFAVAGATGVIVYRLVNTLDAMWGYRTPRFAYFGWAAARLDDGLNFVPARLTALSYALLGGTRNALRCWREQASHCESPNGGPVMTAGAGSLGLRLGGGARYFGVWKDKPAFGLGATPQVADIDRALALVRISLFGWLLLATVAGLVIVGWRHA